MHSILFALVAAGAAPMQVPAAPPVAPAVPTEVSVHALPAPRVSQAHIAEIAVHALPALRVSPAPVAELSVHALPAPMGAPRPPAVPANAVLEHASMASMHALSAPIAPVALRHLAAEDLAVSLPAESWAPQDPADSLWRAARTELDNGNARRAAELYNRLRTERRFASSEYRSHAFYWEAYARHRIGGRAELRAAVNTLAALRSAYPRFENMVEVNRLEGRLNAELAAAGESGAAQRLADQTNRATTQCAEQEIRVTVVESLLMMSSEQAMPLLKQVMSQKDACNAPLREKAVFIISQKRSAEAEDILLDAARSDPAPKVREQAVFWLSQVNSEKSLTAIEEILRTTNDPSLIEKAIFAASQHRSPRSAQILRDIAGRANAPTEARKNAIFWLGQSRSGDVSSFMRGLYESLRETELKEAVLFALSQNRNERNAAFLFEIAMNDREPIEMRKTALFWAGQQSSLPLNRLGDLYRTMPDREMREAIIFTISQRSEPEAVESLIEIARAETDVELKKTVIFWLGQRKDPRAVRYLSDLIGG